MTETTFPTLPFSLSDQLQRALAGRGWVTRAVLAGQLGVSERAIRDASNASGGAILAGNDGLKLTAEATRDEVNHCCGRFSSQVSTTVTRIIQTRAVWQSSHEGAAS